ncbi:hypothetical protein [Burkholderia sp. LMG 21824]|uniref:hypothetical protein n=1 Tax=Burkholderia sp. LMG 21824 TaxID=3158172 RepID=UPI003C2AE111
MYVERYHRAVRYEWLSQYHWEDLDHVRRLTGCGLAITTARTWPLADSRQNSGWPWSLSFYFCAPRKAGDYRITPQSPPCCSNSASRQLQLANSLRLQHSGLGGSDVENWTSVRPIRRWQRGRVHAGAPDTHAYTSINVSRLRSARAVSGANSAD